MFLLISSSILEFQKNFNFNQIYLYNEYVRERYQFLHFIRKLFLTKFLTYILNVLTLKSHPISCIIFIIQSSSYILVLLYLIIYFDAFIRGGGGIHSKNSIESIEIDLASVKMEMTDFFYSSFKVYELCQFLAFPGCCWLHGLTSSSSSLLSSSHQKYSFSWAQLVVSESLAQQKYNE